MSQKSTAPNIELSIIIPSYKRCDLLNKLLKTIIQHSSEKTSKVLPVFEIIVVDDGSPNLSEKENMLNELDFPFPFTFLKQKNAGPASARNHGLKHAQGRFIAFLDDDALPEKNWFHEILQGYEKNDTIAGISGKNITLDPQTLTEKFLDHIQHLNQHQYKEDGSVAYMCTVNCSFKKSVLDQVKGFDESFRYPAGEDMDISFRVRKLGYIFQHNQNAIVFHKHRQSLFQLYKMFFLTGRGTYKCVAHNSDFDQSFTDEFSFKIVKVLRSLKNTLLDVIKTFFKNTLSSLKHRKLEFHPTLFLIMNMISLFFYQLGRFYEKFFGSKPSID